MNKKRKLLWLALLGGLIVKLAYFIYGRKRKQKITEAVKANFKKFIKEEEKEILKYEKGEEPFKKYCRDSANIFKDYFIPNECNEHKPKILRTKSLLAIIIVLMALKLGVTGYLFLSQPDLAKMESQLVADILTLVNSEREKNNLKPLALNPALSASALAKADNMLILGYFSHYGPDGKKPWDWISREEYPYLFVGENLAMDFYTAAAVHSALLASPTHRNNLLSEKYEDIGLAVATGELNGEKTNVLVQLFASRQKPSLALAATTDKTTAGTTKTQETVKTKTAPVSKVNESAPKPSAQEEPAGSEPEKTGEPAPAAAPLPAPESAVGANESGQDSEENAASEFAADSSAVLAQSNEEEIELKKHQAFLSELMVQDNEILSPNPELEAGLLARAKYIVPAPEAKGLAFRLVQWSKYVYTGFLILIILALLLNIFVRITIQHKPVIIETAVVILFISGLLAIRLHFIEYIADKIAIL